MSRTYEALRKAEAETKTRSQSVPETVRGAGRHGSPKEPHIVWELKLPARVEYEKIRVWLTNPAARGQRLQTVMVVGCRSGTGTTTTAALLASTLAEATKSRVVIIDGNFRTPALNAIFQVRSNEGLSQIISDGTTAETQIHPTNRQNLFVLTSGQIPISPSQVFEGEAMDRFLNQLRQQFDFVIFDAAPVLEFPDAYALAPKVDSIILVVEAESTSIEEAQRARRDLERAGGHILGVVLNRYRDYTPAFLRKLSGAHQ